MPESSTASKGEKTPWTRALRWLCLLMLLLTLMLMFYNSTGPVSWPLNLWPTRSSKQYSSTTTSALSQITPSHNEPSHNEPSHNEPSHNEPSHIEPSHIEPSHDKPSHYLVAYPHQYHSILNEPNRCRQESPFLVLMIPVAPHDREARDIIRNTWGKEAKVLGQVVQHYFMLGLSRLGDGTEAPEEQVLQESQTHHDILQSDFLDSYNNLTIKTMLMFEWLSTHCPGTPYAMKVDSDMFLNVHKLVAMLLKAPQHLYMTGMVARGAAVLRDPNSKWFLPDSVFPDSSYPPYALGLGYVFSMDLPKKLLEASLHVPAVYIEDVYVGLCMKHLGLPLTDPPDWRLFRASQPDVPDSCYWTSVITTILQNSNQLSGVWETYQTQTQSGC